MDKQLNPGIVSDLSGSQEKEAPLVVQIWLSHHAILLHSLPVFALVLSWKCHHSHDNDPPVSIIGLCRISVAKMGQVP